MILLLELVTFISLIKNVVVYYIPYRGDRFLETVPGSHYNGSRIIYHRQATIYLNPKFIARAQPGLYFGKVELIQTLWPV